MAVIVNGELFPSKELLEWTGKVLTAAGVPGQEASILADSMIEANLRGVDTHGITRMLATYVKRIQAGGMKAETKIEILRDRPSTALVDCHNGIGQVASQYAMDIAIEKAKKTGSAFVLTTHSNHYGAAAYWAMKALEHGMIGFSSTNGPASAAPFGGRETMLSTNPFAIAIPAKQERPFVLDLATTMVARGRIGLYARQDRELEPGWAFDSMGRPTTNPHEAMKGFLAYIGGYKGYGIAFAVDIISGVLSGSNYGAHFPGFLAEKMDVPTDVGSVFAAIDIESFMDLPEFLEAMDTVIREVKSCKKAEGTERIYIPGEIEFELKEKRLAEGIPFPKDVVDDFRTLGVELGVPFPL